MVTAVTQGRGPLGAVYDRVVHRFSADQIPVLPTVAERPVRLVIGPANEAEQGYQWARAAERANPAVAATAVIAVDPGGYGVQADLVVPPAVALRSEQWHERFEGFLCASTHVLIESAIPLLGRRYRTDVAAEVGALQAAGVRVGLLFHGSDLRLPSRHRRQVADSPFGHPDLPTAILEEKAARAALLVAELGLPVFVSTPDLLRDAPAATWLPLAIDVERWAVDRAGAAPRASAPVVLHAPSNPLIKGSHRIDPIVQALADEGLIEYRRVRGLSHAEMTQQYAEADIVLDQFLIGSYGAAACEAMAAGCLVVGHVDESTRRTVRQQTGVDLPIVEATVATLDGVLRALIAEPVERLDGRRRAAVAFVRAVHDGRRSAQALADFLAS